MTLKKWIQDPKLGFQSLDSKLISYQQVEFFETILLRLSAILRNDSFDQTKTISSTIDRFSLIANRWFRGHFCRSLESVFKELQQLTIKKRNFRFKTFDLKLWNRVIFDRDRAIKVTFSVDHQTSSELAESRLLDTLHNYPLDTPMGSSIQIANGGQADKAASIRRRGTRTENVD